MAINVFPVDAIAGVPEYTGRELRQTLGAALGGATAARPLGARTGVRHGTPATTVTVAAGVWSCGLVAGVIDGEAAGEAGGYWFANDAAVTGPVTAADGTNPRIDIIYAQVDDPAEGDGTAAPLVRIAYLAGTAAGTPAAPATPDRAFVLAQINVPASGGGDPTVTWVAPYLEAGYVVVRTLTERNALAAVATTDAPVLVYLKSAGGFQVCKDGWTWQNVGGYGETQTANTVSTTALTASARIADHGVIAAADYDRVVEFVGVVNISGVSANAAWQAVVTSAGEQVSSNVVATARFPFTATIAVGGSATVAGSYDVAAGVATARPSLWAEELSGTGTLTPASSSFRVRIRAKG